MRLAIASDIHLEVNDDISIINGENANVLVLAGDICNFSKLHTGIYDKFFKNISKQFNSVIYVPGNHEYYDYNLLEYNKAKHYFNSNYVNIHLINNDYVTHILGNRTFNFICSTLWTNMKNKDPIVCFDNKRNIADFKYIMNGDVKMKPEDYYDLNLKSLSNIKELMKLGGNIVMVTHHAPSYNSRHERYINDYSTNAAFYNNLDDFIMDNDIKLWIHGHTHDTFDYMINTTRVVCNPRGYYPYENSKNMQNGNVFKLKYVDL